MTTQTAIFTANGTWTAPSTLLDGIVEVTVAAAAGQATSAFGNGGRGAICDATIPVTAGSTTLTIKVASGSTGYHNGGLGHTFAGQTSGNGGGSSAVLIGATVEIETGGGSGSGFGGANDAGTPGSTSGTGAGNGANDTLSVGGGGAGNAPGAQGKGGSSYVSVLPTGITWEYNSSTAGYVTLAWITADAPLAPTLVSPAPSSYLDANAAGVTFQGTYNPNTDSGDLEAVCLRVSQDGGAYNYVNSVGALVSSPQWITPTTGAGAGAGGAFTVALAAGVLADGHTYAWNFACEESSANLQGGFAGTDDVFFASVMPTVTVTGPTGIVETAAPTVTWTEVLGGGDSQTSYRVVVYDLPTTEQSGFAPGSTTPTWDSGVVSSAALFQGIPLGANLLNGTTYVAYVQISETGGEFSLWTASPDFTVQLDAPQMPTIVVQPSTDPITQGNGQPAMQIGVVENDNALSVIDSTFETGGAGSTGSWSGTNCAVSTSTGWAADGSYHLKLTSSGAGTVTAQSNERLIVVGGSTVAFLVEAHAASTARSVTLQALFYDITDTLIGSPVAIQTAADSSGGTALAGTAEAPGNAVFVDIGVSIASVGSGETHDLDCAGIYFNGQPGDWSIGGFVGVATVEVEYSDDGVTWTDVRYATMVLPFDELAIAYDREAPLNKSRSYRARMNATVGVQQLSSAWSAPQSGELVGTRWWLSIPDFEVGLDDTILFAVELWRTTASDTTLSGNLSASFQEDRTEPQGIFTAFGRETSIVVRGTLAAKMPSIVLQFIDDLSYQTFDTIRDQQRTVLLRSDMGDCYYVALPGSRPAVTQSAADRRINPARQLALSACSPVDIP